MIGPSRSLAGPRMERKSRASSVNWFAGKLIPPLLVVYGVWTIPYLWHSVDPARPYGLSLFWIGYIHFWLYMTASSYLRVYIAQEREAGAPLPRREKDCDLRSGLPGSFWAWVRWCRRTFVPLRWRDQYAGPPDERAFQAVRRGMIHQCEPDGSLPRCYRGNCKGRWKPARTRHCSVCQTCRFALDHHCPLFDHDIVARHTFGSFITFLVSAPMLLLPLLPLLWGFTVRHARAIGVFAWTDPEMRDAWWSKRWTWLGGPSLRYFGALVKAQHMLNRRQSAHRLEKWTIWPAAMLFFALMLSTIAIALLGTTICESLEGGLAIDRERHKLWERKARLAAKKAGQVTRKSPGTSRAGTLEPDGESTTGEEQGQASPCPERSAEPGELDLDLDQNQDLGPDCKGPSPWLYFWVPTATFRAYQTEQGMVSEPRLSEGQRAALAQGGVVVKLHEMDRPYSRRVGSWFTVFEHIEPLHAPLAQAQWPLSPSVTKDLARRAARQFAQLP